MEIKYRQYYADKDKKSENAKDCFLTTNARALDAPNFDLRSQIDCDPSFNPWLLTSF
jgi:hypothetical protein